MTIEVKTTEEAKAVQTLLSVMRAHIRPGFFGGVRVDVKAQNGKITHIQDSHEHTQKLVSS